MLYQVTMFWDRTFRGVHAVVNESDDGSAHWIVVQGDGTARTTLFVPDRAAALKLAATINEIVSADTGKSHAEASADPAIQ